VADSKIIMPDGTKSNGTEPEFQSPDFDAPKLANARSRGVHPEIDAFLSSIVADEAALMDICLEKAIQLTERVVLPTMGGIDQFIEQHVPVGMLMAQLAVPMAVEIFKESSKAVALPENSAKLVELVNGLKKIS